MEEALRMTSRKNPLLAHVRKVASSRKYRRACGEYLADGIKMLEEALLWQAPITTVVAGDGIVLPPLPKEVRLVRVPGDMMTYLSPMDSPQGVLFLCRIEAQPEMPSLQGNHYLVLDRVQDPGNIGAIWRSADALGGDGLILTGGCADPWNWKTVRATMGACFRLPVYELEGESLLSLLEEAQLPLIATALREDTRDVREIDLSKAAVVIGSEGHGVSQGLLKRSQCTLRIPMRARCESLNAAAAATVVLWEMVRGTCCLK